MPGTGTLVLYGLLWLVVLMEALVLCSLARKMFGLGSALMAQVANDGPPLGTPMPRVTGTDSRGGNYVLGGSNHRYQAILFLSPECTTCRVATMWVGSFMDRATYEGKVVVSGTMKSVKDFAAEFNVDEPLIPDVKNRLSRQYQVASSPYLIVLDTAGRVIGKGFVTNFRDVGDLVRIAQMREAMGGVPVREEALGHAV
jgi:hypothetical protein